MKSKKIFEANLFIRGNMKWLKNANKNFISPFCLEKLFLKIKFYLTYTVLKKTGKSCW